MELELSLGDSPAPAKGSLTPVLTHAHAGHGKGHELVLELGVTTAKRQDNRKTPMQPEEDVQEEDNDSCAHSELPVALSLGCPLLLASAETGSVNSEAYVRGFDVNDVPLDGTVAKVSSLSTSSLQVGIPVRLRADQEAAENDENGGVGRAARKKLRLSKEQSAFLEESFKEHNTLSPKQKCDLARKLNLRPRQVEVWFQNRRARTKLKQTEVDCEYLKRWCETLTQENRKLQREVAELRAYPFYSHLPAGFSTTRMCPSCGNNAIPYSPVVTAVSSPAVAPPSSMSTVFARPHFGPFTVHPVLRRQPSATS